jgi:hypothetical protein
LAIVGELQKLTFLGLGSTAVTDAGLKHLRTLKNLKKIDLWYTKTTPSGIAELKRVLPELTVDK